MRRHRVASNQWRTGLIICLSLASLQQAQAFLSPSLASSLVLRRRRGPECCAAPSPTLSPKAVTPLARPSGAHQGPTVRQRQIQREVLAAESVSELLAIATENAAELNLVNVSTCLNRLRRLRFKAAPEDVSATLALCESAMSRLLASGPLLLSARDVASLVHGLGAVGSSRSDLLDQLLSRALAGGFSGFIPQDLSTLANGLGRLDYTPPHYHFTSIFEGACLNTEYGGKRGLAAFDPQGIANVVHGLARMGVKPSARFLDSVVAETIARDMAGFNHLDLANTVNALGKLEHLPAAADTFLPAFERACTGAVGLQSFSPQGLVNVIHGLAKMGCTPSRGFTEALVLECVERGFEGFVPQDLSSLVNGLCKLELCPSSPLFLPAFEAACLLQQSSSSAPGVGGMRAFESQHLANTIHGLARAGCSPSGPFLDAAIDACIQRGWSGFTPQQLANLVNGLGKLDHCPTRQLDDFRASFETACLTVQSEGKRGIEAFQAQHLSNIVHGLSRMAVRPTSSFLDSVADEVIARRFADFSPQGMSNLVNGLGKLDHHPAHSECFIRELEAAALAVQHEGDQGLQAFKPQELTILVHGLARMAVTPAESFLEAVVDEVVARDFQDFNSQDLSNLAHALGRLRHRPRNSEFLERFEVACLGLMQGSEVGLAAMDPQDISNILAGLSGARCTPSASFVSELATEMVRRDFQDFSSQHLASSLNGLARLGYRPQHSVLRTFGDVFMSACQSRGLSSFSAVGLGIVASGMGKLGMADAVESKGEGGGDASRQRLLGFMRELLDAVLEVEEGGYRGFSVFSAEGLTNLIHALGRLRLHPGSRLMDAIVKESLFRLGEFTMPQLAKLAWSLHELKHQGMVGAIVMAAKDITITQGVEVLRYAHIGALMKVLSSVDGAMALAIDMGLVEHMVQRLEQLETEGAAVDPDDDRDVEMHCHHSCKQALMLLEGTRLEGQLARMRDVVERGWERCRGRHRLHVASQKQQQVAEFLSTRLGLSVASEARCANDVVSVDLVILAPSSISAEAGPHSHERGVAFEFDGPSHFYLDRPDVPTRTTDLKRCVLDRAVRRGSWRAWVAMSYQEWDAARDDDAKRGLVASLLRARGVELEDFIEAKGQDGLC